MLTAKQNKALVTEGMIRPDWVLRQETDITDENGVPWCCRNCWKLGWDYDEWGGQTAHYCEVNVPNLPTKKGTCKKQKPWRTTPEADHDGGQGDE